MFLDKTLWSCRQWADHGIPCQDAIRLAKRCGLLDVDPVTTLQWYGKAFRVCFQAATWKAIMSTLPQVICPTPAKCKQDATLLPPPGALLKLKGSVC